jgi:hypothetical protein
MIYYFARTSTTPEVNFNFSNNSLSLSGEAYPENAAEFFNPILEKLQTYLSSIDNETVTFNVDLTYFNSAATKMLYRLFGLLNDAAAAGNQIILNWYHDEEDVTSLEFGEDIKEEFCELNFNPIATH